MWGSSRKLTSRLSLQEFSREFDYRHDFQGEDLPVLCSNHPNVRFDRIPEAWIVVADQMLRQIGRIDSCAVAAVRQDFGFLTVIYHSGHQYPEIIRELVRIAEKRLYLIDADLHRQLDYR